jgi:hypothetical protein
MTSYLTASWQRIPPRLRRTIGLARAVLAALLTSALNARCIQRTSDDVVSHSGEIPDAAASDQHYGVLLERVPFSRDVRRHLDTVGQAHASYFSQRGVGLLRSHRPDVRAHPSLLGASRASDHPILYRVVAEEQSRRLCLLLRRLSSMTDKLINRRQLRFFLSPLNNFGIKKAES